MLTTYSLNVQFSARSDILGYHYNVNWQVPGIKKAEKLQESQRRLCEVMKNFQRQAKYQNFVTSTLRQSQRSS